MFYDSVNLIGNCLFTSKCITELFYINKYKEIFILIYYVRTQLLTCILF